MYKFVFLVFLVCSVEAMDKRIFGKIIDDFKIGDYESCVTSAMTLGKNDSNAFVNDSRFFLSEFFDCMAKEQTSLERFRGEISKMCANVAKKLGYYSNYDTMMAVFGNLALDKYEQTSNLSWIDVRCVNSLSDEEYSDDVKLISCSHENSDEDLCTEEEDVGTVDSIRDIAAMAIRNGWL